jgi:hypothetical protein
MRWMRRITIAVACGLSCLMMIGCGSGNFVTLPDPYKGVHVTRSSGNNTSGSFAQQADEPQHISNKVGMGDTKSWIERHWGKPTKVISPMNPAGTGDMYYRHNQIFVRFSTQRVYQVDETFPKPISTAQANQVVNGMIPTDSKQTMRLSTNGKVVVWYHSASIQNVLPQSIWPSLSGTFTVVMQRTTGGQVTEIIVEPGQTES